MARQGFMRILPSGRALRWAKPTVPDYKRARERITVKGKLSDLADALLPYVITGITAAPVPEILGEPEKDESGQVLGEDRVPLPVDQEGRPLGKPLRYIDEAAMVKSVAPPAEGGKLAAGGWIELNYLKLVTKNRDSGDSLFSELFDDYVDDYLAAESEVVRMLVGGEDAVRRPPGAPPTKM